MLWKRQAPYPSTNTWYSVHLGIYNDGGLILLLKMAAMTLHFFLPGPSIDNHRYGIAFAAWISDRPIFDRC